MKRCHHDLISHSVDTLSNITGRDQQMMPMRMAMELVSCFDNSTFLDPQTVFLNPFCKGGGILLAAALRTCELKYKHASDAVTVDHVEDELYSNRYYGLAIDKRHYFLSKRTFYGNERSHQEEATLHIHGGDYLSEVDGRLIREKFVERFQSMIEYIKKNRPDAKIVAVGNPPFQEADQGFGGSASPIYPFFVESLLDSEAICEFVLVLPSRWFACGKGLDKFRNRMRNLSLKSIRHFKNSKDVFPAVDVLGGVCFCHYQDGHDDRTIFFENNKSYQVDLGRLDIILDDPSGYQLVDKVLQKWRGKYVSDIAWTRKPFGLSTDYFKKNPEAMKHRDAIPCFSKGRKVRYVEREKVKKNNDKIHLYKVAIPRAYAPGSKKGVRRVTLPIDQCFLVDSGEIVSETYNIVGAFQEKKEANRFLQYLRTDFARYFLGLRKTTQDIPKDRWNWVPLVDMNTEWTDAKLFDYFQLTKKEREHIRKKVEEWS